MYQPGIATQVSKEMLQNRVDIFEGPGGKQMNLVFFCHLVKMSFASVIWLFLVILV